MRFDGVLLLMAALASGAADLNDARNVAAEIARTDATEREAAILVVTAFEESRFTADKVSGDHLDRCAYQLRYAPRTVTSDLRQCTEIALVRIRISARKCPSYPLSDYASGSCNLAHAISRYRMAEADRILRSVSGT